MTVAQNIGYGLQAARRGDGRDRRARRRDADAAAARGLRRARRSTQLSGGQRQRVALGRALAVDPSLLLLDEPMSNLDYKVRIELRHEMRALQKRLGITAVYVTHDREEALTLADRIAVLDAGRIAQHRHAGGDLPPAGVAVRRGLHGRRQCDRARARGARRRAGAPDRAPASRVDRALPQRRRARSTRPRSARISAARRRCALAGAVVAGARTLGQGYRYRVAHRRRGRRGRTRSHRIDEARAVAVVGSARCAAAVPRRLARWSRAPAIDCRVITQLEEESMKRRMLLLPSRSLARRGWPATRAAQTTLNVVTAGDQNMVDYVNNYLGPQFEKKNPGVKVRAVGTGPGDAGSQKIYEKLSAQQKAGTGTWDVDVAVVHQRGAATMVQGEAAGALPQRRSPPASWSPRDTAKNALGANVDGYVMPMFHSQIAFAYNPDAGEDAAEELRRARRVGEEEPEAVRLQRHQGRHVRRRLRHGLGLRQQRRWPTSSMKGPYDADAEGDDREGAGEPEGVQPERRDDAGQRRHARHAEPRRDRDGPGLGRHVLHVDGRRQAAAEHEAVAASARACPASRCTTSSRPRPRTWRLAKKFVELADSPAVQAEGIVKQFNWYPGIDAAVRAVEAGRRDLEQALRRRHAGGSRDQGKLSRSRRTSTTSWRATRSRSRIDRLNSSSPR